MRLKSFSVKKFRSITRTERIILGPCTVLVGPNNEGKSNILRALVLGMRILTRERYVTTLGRRRVVYYRIGDYYNWERDYPINLQERQKDGKTELILEFPHHFPFHFINCSNIGMNFKLLSIVSYSTFGASRRLFTLIYFQLYSCLSS